MEDWTENMFQVHLENIGGLKKNLAIIVVTKVGNDQWLLQSKMVEVPSE